MTCWTRRTTAACWPRHTPSATAPLRGTRDRSVRGSQAGCRLCAGTRSCGSARATGAERRRLRSSQPSVGGDGPASSASGARSGCNGPVLAFIDPRRHTGDSRADPGPARRSPHLRSSVSAATAPAAATSADRRAPQAHQEHDSGSRRQMKQ